jgi:hypothetical protein
MKDRIVIRGARQHNLKNLDLDLPRRAVIVVTGPSGSGKSSLAFDTVYAEGQRRYVESLSTYAKQFLDRMEKPDVDRVEGISPAVAIEQRNPTKTSRSTVGTATEVHDYLRLLWARVGRTYCPGTHPDRPCGREVRPDTVQSATDAVLGSPPATRIMVCFPLPLSARVTHALVAENLRALGFLRVLADGRELHLDELPEGADLTRARELLVVVDRLRVDPDDARARLADSLQTAFTEGEGEAVVSRSRRPAMRFTERFRCPEHPEIEFATPTPQLFSFNNPYGSCPECTGFGAVLEYDPDLIVPNHRRSPPRARWTRGASRATRRGGQKLLAFARRQGGGLDRRAVGRAAPEAFRRAVIDGTRGFQGVLPFLADAGGEAVQAVHPRLPAAVPERGLPHLRWREAASGGAPGAGGRAHHRRGLTPAPLARLMPWLGAMREGRTGAPDCPEPPLTAHERAIADSILRELDHAGRVPGGGGLGYLTSTGRRAPSPAARRSGSRSPTRWGAGWWTRCTCWTSPPSASIPPTTRSCCACSSACASRGTP